LSRSLAHKVREMNPPGRFLKRHPKEHYWEDMSDDEEKCREKCAQVLRDAIAFVGLKEAASTSTGRREQLLQHNPFSGSNEQLLQHNPFSMRESNTVAMHAQMYQQQMQRQVRMQMNPFVMSAESSNEILRHQQHMLARDFPSRQCSFPNHNQPQATRLSLAPSNESLDLLGFPGEPGYASLPQTRQSDDPRSFLVRPGMPARQGDGRPSKRPRHMINPFFDPFAALPGETAYGYDRRWSIPSNSYPAGTNFSSRNIPGPRLEVARRDSFFGNLSLGANGSDHTLRDFELFPDIAENADCVAPPRNDSDEFSSDFC
jgi:hypothetical protein